MQINTTNTTDQQEAIMQAVKDIQRFVEEELRLKTESIKRQTAAIESLIAQRDEYKQQVSLLQQELLEVRHIAEGKRQLVDKLLGDIARLQQDVEWYRRTYEERSFWGTIKEKIKRKL